MLAIGFLPDHTSSNLLNHETLGGSPSLRSPPDIAITGLWQLNFSKLASSSVIRDDAVSIVWLVYKLNEIAWKRVNAQGKDSTDVELHEKIRIYSLYLARYNLPQVQTCKVPYLGNKQGFAGRGINTPSTVWTYPHHVSEKLCSIRTSEPSVLYLSKKSPVTC